LNQPGIYVDLSLQFLHSIRDNLYPFSWYKR
jgi:hypothetical protein